MTVHAVEIICSKNQESNPGSVPKPDPPDLHGVAHDRVKDHIKYNFTPVLEGQDSPMSLRKAGELTNYSVDHAFGRYRSDDLEAFYVVPINSELCEAVGVDSLQGDDFDYFRRGRMKMSKNRLHSVDDRVHAVKVNGTYMVIGPSGKAFITENDNFHPRDVV